MNCYGLDLVYLSPQSCVLSDNHHREVEEGPHGDSPLLIPCGCANVSVIVGATMRWTLT